MKSFLHQQINIGSGDGLVLRKQKALTLTIDDQILQCYIYGVSRSHWVNSSPCGQNGSHFTDDIFGCIFVNEKFLILIKISLKFVPQGPINNKPALV